MQEVAIPVMPHLFYGNNFPSCLNFSIHFGKIWQGCQQPLLSELSIKVGRKTRKETIKYPIQLLEWKSTIDTSTLQV